MHSTQLVKLFIVLLLATAFFTACQKEIAFKGNSPQFRISQDTLRFDTVFTTIGSATRFIKVYNDESEFIEVDIALAGNNSPFRLNVDGISASSLEMVEIPPNDSIYIFAEVTINPDEPVSISPFISEDQVVITSGESSTTLYLEAFGQNANYISPPDGRSTILTCDFGQEVWDDPKPYVVYGILDIRECTLILPEGCRIYVHGGIVLDDDGSYNDGIIVTRQDGKIISQGSLSNPIIIQGDRLESEFQEVPGQWVGVIHSVGSKGNYMRHTTIKNSIVGVYVDSLADIYLDRCQIFNTTASGITSVHGSTRAENTLIHSNGSYGIQLTFGGSHEYIYCTVGSYGNQREALRIDNYKCTDALCIGEILVNPLSASFTNCAFTGSTRDELFMDDITNGEQSAFFQYDFTNCLVRVEDLLDSENFPNFFDHCSDCLNYQNNDPLFVSTEERDYHPDTLSVLEMRAIPLGEIGYDLEDKSRDPVQPDIGCYESSF